MKRIKQSKSRSGKYQKHTKPKSRANSRRQKLPSARRLRKEKKITREFLRKASEYQSVTPFEGQTLIQANMRLLKQHQLQQGINPRPMIEFIDTYNLPRHKAKRTSRESE